MNRGTDQNWLHIHNKASPTIASLTGLSGQIHTPVMGMALLGARTGGGRDRMFRCQMPARAAVIISATIILLPARLVQLSILEPLLAIFDKKHNVHTNTTPVLIQLPSMAGIPPS
jgi:hypothetical protein